jgi:folate-binding protein YgfZ
MLIKTDLKTWKICGQNVEKIINKLSASEGIYLFFLNSSGFYIADLFFFQIEDEYFIASFEEVLKNFENHVKKYDLRSEISFFPTQLFFYFSNEPTDFKDPRFEDIYFRVEEKPLEACEYKEFEKVRIKEEIAQFTDFEFEKSIILNYGKISKFISLKKGCYPGQELISFAFSRGQIKKTLRCYDHARGKVLAYVENLFLVQELI